MVHWVWSLLTWLLWLLTHVILKLGVLQGWVSLCVTAAHVDTIWGLCGCERLRAKCQQDPTTGTQSRVGTRCGRCGSIYQGLMRYFYVANVSFSCFSQGYVGVGEGHVGRKWDINVLLEKAEQYLGGIETWNWFYGSVLWRDQQVELRNVAGGTSAHDSVPCIGLYFDSRNVYFIHPRPFHSLFTHEPISRLCEVLHTGSEVK